jgi:aminoglycoside phosphotransferase (APT) family kinase protein
MRSPDAELDIDEALIRRLLDEQHPDLSALPLVFFAEGWDNALWQLGAEFIVRLPRRALAAPLARTEQRWLPVLSRMLPLPIPVPIRTGVPGCGYPWSWSIVPMLHGTRASRTVPLRSVPAAQTFAAFLRALHQPCSGGRTAQPMASGPTLRSTRIVLSTRGDARR